MKTILSRPGFVAVAFLLLLPMARSSAGELIYGCMTRPACGKMCKLVCEMKTLTAVGYGCECKPICIPGPSQAGCKHCYTTCCCDTTTKGCPPKISFCWYDWCTCGCAAPRQVKVLTKYQAEKKICWYHWEVVDGCNCDCAGGPNGRCDCVYKPAPAEAVIGQTVPISPEEQVELTAWMVADAAKKNAEIADAFNLPETQVAQQMAMQPQTVTVTATVETTPVKPTMGQRLSSLFKIGK